MTNFEFYKDILKELVKSNDPISPKLAELTNNDSWPTFRDFIAWMFEEYSILTEEEREYLKNFIRPFKERVVSITKRNFSDRYEYLEFIAIEPYDRQSNFALPLFREGTMYKAMELHKVYTLEELGL